MQSITGFALLGLFAAALLAVELCGLSLLLRRPQQRGPYDTPFGDVPGKRT
jgi:hypothetical protein